MNFFGNVVHSNKCINYPLVDLNSASIYKSMSLMQFVLSLFTLSRLILINSHLIRKLAN